MVALSVSISANKLPLFTVAPTFLFQPAMTPSVIVSLSLGINTTSSILLISRLLVCVADPGFLLLDSCLLSELFADADSF
jgi:hypothetical protein